MREHEKMSEWQSFLYHDRQTLRRRMAKSVRMGVAGGEFAPGGSSDL